MRRAAREAGAGDASPGGGDASGERIDLRTPDGGAPAAPAAAGVYVVLDDAGATQYVGMSRNLRATLAAHAAELPEVAASASLSPMPAATKDQLVAAWKRGLAAQIKESGVLPPGNAKGAPAAWAKPNTGAAAAARRALSSPRTGGSSGDVEAEAVAAWRAAPAAERRRAAKAALEADASDAEAAFALYEAEDELGDGDAAVAALRAALAADPSHAAAARLLAAAEGGADAASAAANDAAGAVEYARQIFDGYATTFDEHLTGTLKYSVPKELALAADAASGGGRSGVDPPRYACIVDAGCGTGLSVEPFAGRADSVIGIDVSSKMLEVARGKGLYSTLLCDDLVSGLATLAQGQCDLIISADTLMYVGRLDGFFEQAERVLASGGVLAFSVESAERATSQGDAGSVELGEDGIGLQPSGRFCHTRGYVEGLAARSGDGDGGAWETAAEPRDVIGRMDGDKPVYATLHVFVRR